MNRYALLVGTSSGFTIPLIEVRNRKQLLKQLILDLELLVNYGDEPWWSPTNMASHLNGPKPHAFGDVVGSAASYEAKIVPYNPATPEIDLTQCAGSFYVTAYGYPGSLESYWGVVEFMDGGWFFEPDSPLLTQKQIEKVCLTYAEIGGKNYVARPYGESAKSFRKPKSAVGGVGYNARFFI